METLCASAHRKYLILPVPVLEPFFKGLHHRGNGHDYHGRGPRFVIKATSNSKSDGGDRPRL